VKLMPRYAIKRLVVSLFGTLALVLVALTIIFAWKNLRGVGPIFQESSGEISQLRLPSGFGISIFAKDLPGARVIVQDGLGNFWVSQPSEGAITLLEVRDGKVANQIDIFRGLNKPHGLALDPQDGLTLYIAETDKISKVRLYTEAEIEKIADLPGGGNHFSRTIAFGPDDRLYVSIGSSCNVCHESDNRRAKIFSMKKDGSDFKEYARGLRNAVFFTWSYVDGRMWATEMGRDLLGDDLPPDEINIIEPEGNPSTGLRARNYGWPTCYGKNIHDSEFDKNTYIRNPCMEPFEIPSYIDIPAHSAPLGLAFIPEDPPSLKASDGQGGWPEEFWYNLLVAYHGSWNRTEPTGYKVVRMKLDAQGKFLGIEDFITGWLQNDGSVIGRPVDILIRPGGVMYITDDKADVVYKVFRKEEKPRNVKVNMDLLKLDKPQPNAIVKSPLTIEGSARGFWFFEASFPIRVLDANGKELGISHVQALENWMTTEFVTFSGAVTFKTPTTDTGTLVLEKDNPSGLPENAAEVRYPIRFR